MSDTETISKLYLELAHVTGARNYREVAAAKNLRIAIENLNKMDDFDADSRLGIINIYVRAALGRLDD